jgi:hypothetical protein
MDSAVPLVRVELDSISGLLLGMIGVLFGRLEMFIGRELYFG